MKYITNKLLSFISFQSPFFSRLFFLVLVFLVLPISIYISQQKTNVGQFAATGNQCGGCAGACNGSIGYCEQPQCTNNNKNWAIYKCDNGNWTFHYNQATGSCYNACIGSTPTPSISPTPPFQACQTLPITVPVIVMGYFPPDPNDPTHVDPIETGKTLQEQIQEGSPGGKNLTIQDWENNVTKMASAMSQVVSDNTRYHGYKDPTAPEFLNYQILDTKFFTKAIPHSTYVLTEGTNHPIRPDYNKTMQDLGNVCDYVDGQGVKEIWVYAYHSTVVSPDESRMASKYGDVSNSFPQDPGYPQQFHLPQCQNSYVMYNFEYWADPNFIANTIHDRMHEIENTMSYAADTYQITWPRTPPNSTNMFWYNFGLYEAENKGQISCGDTHNPPNTAQLNDPYHYDVPTSVNSNCETWDPDQTKSTFANVSCQNWGCTAQGYYKWWMQNLPGYNNGITYQGQPMRNWWEAMYDFNAFISQKRSLLGSSIFSCLTTPSPTPSNTPTPENTPTPTQPSSVSETPGTNTQPVVNVTLCPHGLGNCGDNANIQGGNPQPLHQVRQAVITLFDSTGVQVNTQTLSVNFVNNAYSGSTTLTNITSGNYIIKIKLDGFLNKQVPGFQIISSTTTTLTLPNLSVTTGDINNDNQLDILDYNLLISCFGSKQQTPSCTTPPTQDSSGTDLTDDGKVDGGDYNLFLRELSVQKE